MQDGGQESWERLKGMSADMAMAEILKEDPNLKVRRVQN